MNQAKHISRIVFACLAFAACQAAEAGIAGKAYFTHGGVRVIDANGQSHPLRKGLLVFSGDTIATGQEGSAQIRMLDGGVIAVRPASVLKIDQFIYHGKKDGQEKNFFSLLRGGLRAITGLIGEEHKSNYQIRTAAATIGVRGTDHEIQVVAPNTPQAAKVTPGTYNMVNTGRTFMANGNGSTNIQPNQMGFAGAQGQAPQLQPLNVALFTVTPPAPQQSTPQKVRASVTVDHGVIGNAVNPPLTVDATVNATPRVTITGHYGGFSSPPQTIVF